MTPVHPYGKWVLLLLAALSPRLWRLDRFITADEILFLDHARDLSLTLGIGYPGVTLAWANALGLWVLFGLSRLGLIGALPNDLASDEFLTAIDAQPVPYYVAGRVVTAVLVTVLLLLFYVLTRRLLDPERYLASHHENRDMTEATRVGPNRAYRNHFDRALGGEVALLAALLLALDPYVLGYSRLMHIAAPLALLMLLTGLAWMLWLQEGLRRWLLLAGLFCGLALLTKSAAVLLFPILLALALVFWLIGRPAEKTERSISWAWWGRVFAGWLSVLGITALVFTVLWPAMWQDPGEALALTFGKLWVDREAGQGNLGMFWMGRFVEDPGLAFYAVALLLKLSPLMFIGLAINLFSLRPTRERWAEWGLWTYALLYLLVMTVATKKSVRYMLPAFAAFAPLAAYGLIRVGHWGWGRITRWRTDADYGDPGARPLGWRSMLLALGVLLLVALPYAPHYLSYYSPLLLGWRWAPEAILVGWGEGLGDAARYLNQGPGAEGATVAAWYDWTFAPFFVGQTLPLATESAMRADYSVFYINQVQRNIPDPNLVTYFQRRQPEHVVRLNGIDYAWIYPAVSSYGSPPASAIPVDVPMADAVSLEGYEIRPAPAAGDGVIITLYWRALQSELPDYFVYARAVDDTGQIHARADSPPVMGFWPTSRWEAGSLVVDEQVLTRPPETEPGTYRLEVGMYDPQTWAVLEPASGERGEGGGLLLGEVSLP